MWLTVPDVPLQILWEGSLEAEPDVLQRDTNGFPAAERADFIRNLPIISIGRPEAWPIGALYSKGKMPITIQSKLDEANFYLVRLSCSFRPTANGPEVEWARYQVSLLPDLSGHRAVAFDLHPLQVTNDVKRNTKVTLSPSLKFQEVSLGGAGIEFGFEYTQIEPLVSATGAGESSPSWDYQAAKGTNIQGSKWMHLLVSAPHDMHHCFATLDLTADVVKQGLRLPVFSKPQIASAEPRNIQIW